jgi:hypothetical protein
MIGSTAIPNNNINNSSTNNFPYNMSTQLTANLINASVVPQQFEAIRKWLGKNHKKVF